jgi:hypothetical protein
VVIFQTDVIPRLIRERFVDKLEQLATLRTLRDHLKVDEEMPRDSAQETRSQSEPRSFQGGSDAQPDRRQGDLATDLGADPLDLRMVLALKVHANDLSLIAQSGLL